MQSAAYTNPRTQARVIGSKGVLCRLESMKLPGTYRQIPRRAAEQPYLRLLFSRYRRRHQPQMRSLRLRLQPQLLGARRHLCIGSQHLIHRGVIPPPQGVGTPTAMTRSGVAAPKIAQRTSGSVVLTVEITSVAKMNHALVTTVSKSPGVGGGTIIPR